MKNKMLKLPGVFRRPKPAPTPAPPGPRPIDQVIRRRNFLSFSVFTATAAAGYFGWRWLYHSPVERSGITGHAHKPLRRALNQNELIFRNLFSDDHHVKQYPKSRAAGPAQVSITGDIGMGRNFDWRAWKLEVTRASGKVFQVTLEEMMTLPVTEITYDFKCVEGWDQISNWAGVRFSDFIRHYGLDEEARMNYVGFSTPDDGYYVGIDMPSALHPQTLLAYKMHDRFLTLEHGFPLRLIIPVKYGIKNIKRIGFIEFSNERTDDYWAEQGYDYYSGL